jgi:predicted RNA-binding Zn ribbon-like protein
VQLPSRIGFSESESNCLCRLAFWMARVTLDCSLYRVQPGLDSEQPSIRALLLPGMPYMAPAPPRFDFLGHSLWLDFVNTLPGGTAAAPDRLRGWRDFVAWAESAGILDPGTAARARSGLGGQGGDKLLGEARRLRDALRALAEGARDGIAPAGLPEAVGVVNQANQAAPGSIWLVSTGAGFRAELRDSTQSPRRWLGPIARDAADWLVRGPWDRIRGCAAPGCGLLFLDVSRNGRRRWCSMATCGNRQKARAFQRRARAGGGTD